MSASETLAVDALTSRLDFARLLDQRHRLMQVQTALPALSLIPERVVMREAVGQPFELQLQCLSTSAHLELKTLLGEQISLKLLQSDGAYVPWHGYVFEAAQLGADGGLARYALTMRPWLSALALRRNSRVFHDQTAIQVIEAVLADHQPQSNWRFEVSEPLRVRSLCTQYRETDLAFVQRLLAAEGMSYHFEHLDGQAAADADAAQHARHVMVITDRLAQRPALGTVRFTSQHATAGLGGQRDSITAFMAQRDLAPNAVTLAAWDYKRLAGLTAEDASTLDLGELPVLQVYDGSGAYRYESPEHAQRAAALALAALELDFKRFEGQGSARHFKAGHSFELIDHPLYGANSSAFNYSGALLASHQRATQSQHNAFTLLAVEHHCANNLGADLAALLGHSDIEHGTYKNHFHCAPAAAVVVPRHLPQPTAWGVQSATVVGLSEEPVETERDHRIRVRFAWQDASGGAAGENTGNFPTNAPGTWVRVAAPWAGANWGASLVPRIGSEVAIEFIEGDIDRPVVVGALYNGADAPPFAAGVDSGVNHSGVLSGWHTHSLDQCGFNQWVLDDATGQLRMRLACSYTAAEVGLGHLIGQNPASAQRGAWRGSGFEAASQGWGVLRAAQGLLISTSARSGTYGSAQSTQMDASEAVAQLKGARDLGQRLSDAAAHSGALALHSHDGGTSVQQLTEQIDPQAQGKLGGSLNGQNAVFDPAGSRDGSTPVHQFAQPVAVLDTPSSLVLASDGPIAQYASEHLGHVSQGDVQLSAAHTASQVSGQTTSLFTHTGGLQVKAANGPVSLRAHTDTLQLLANKDIQILSVNSEITVSAQSKIELIGADSGITLEGGNITFTTPGTWNAKG
ncbi:MAG: type VI secretion system Vgr family protein, partial [Hydrogenophaga sp.]|uniref:type VI secretion system Vgr family protein n=1 Tax=Hydrogenophaga sp. TaxID=1904254 RepID=UPI003D9B0B9D